MISIGVLFNTPSPLFIENMGVIAHRVNSRDLEAKGGSWPLGLCSFPKGGRVEMGIGLCNQKKKQNKKQKTVLGCTNGRYLYLC